MGAQAVADEVVRREVIDTRAQSIAHLFRQRVAASGSREALQYLVPDTGTESGERLERLTWDQTRERADLWAAGLVALGGPGPLDALRHRDLARQATVAIDALSPKLRDALLLAQSGDYAYAEVAAMLKVPVGTVKWRVSEARRQVRQRLSALGFVDGD